MVLIVIGIITLLAATRNADTAIGTVGAMLLICSAVYAFIGLRRTNASGQRRAWLGSSLTFLMGLLLINAPALAGTALIFGLTLWFVIDGLGQVATLFRNNPQHDLDRRWIAAAAAGNLGVAAILLLFATYSSVWIVAIAGALRIFGTAWDILITPIHQRNEAAEMIAEDLHLDGEAGKSAVDEAKRISQVIDGTDGASLLAFACILFAIHLSRMGFDRTWLGIMSPAVAAIGDLLFALVIAYFIIFPLRIVLMKLTTGWEGRLWTAYGNATETSGVLRKFFHGWLLRRIQMRVRLREARYSIAASLRHGLKIGLPYATIMAATIPMAGMSWYFDTENWASGIWNSWAAERTDAWREAMVRAVDPDAKETFLLAPPDVSDAGDFSFVVVGDPGEGDASQLALSSEIVSTTQQPDVKFLMISSDVIYPAGSMKNYETRFWLPFQGVTKPVYAIPGNHDWYDALEGFSATFFTPDSARAAITARAAADLNISSTDPRHADALIATVERLRSYYKVTTQNQRAPFFQISTNDFVLIAVDTGVARSVDEVQYNWLERALLAARGKFIMVVLGHPFYAGGSATAVAESEFDKLHKLLQRSGVNIVMAGDTHDLEYYQEENAGGRIAHHFVNGGGGAYLSLGTALSWPAEPASQSWTYYPSRSAIVEKIDHLTSRFKWPFWLWTKSLNGYPFSSEWLSAAFDYNTAPFFQSFIEVRVERSLGRVRLIPHGVNGPLQWSDFTRSSDFLSGAANDRPAEWIIPLH